MKGGRFIIVSALCLFCSEIYAQEHIKNDSVKLNTDSLIMLREHMMSPQVGEYSADFRENMLNDPMTEIPEVQNIEFKLRKPFYIPPYYSNSSPRFYGDYTTGGRIFPNFYGSGMQETLPGLGRLNQASLFYRYDLNDYFLFRQG